MFRTRIPFRTAVAVTIASILAAPARELVAAQRAPDVIVRGTVVERQTREPLAHAMITLVPAGRQTFTDDSGRFTLVQVRRGSYTLRVAHLGHSPSEREVRLADDSAIAPLRIELARISIRLSSVTVLANPPCVAPGPPDPVREPELAVLFEQLTQNAAQFRLLSDSFPFEYQMERRLRTPLGAGTVALVQVETLLIRSNENRWAYRPGNDVSGGTFGGERTLHVPTLADFAGAAFQQNHCFQYLGTADSGGTRLIEIGFRAADRIRTPDVHGSVWLDAGTFRIRKAELQLSRMPAGARNLTALRAETVFREVERLIPVFGEIRAVREYRGAQPGLEQTSATETQRLIYFAWRGRAPGAPAARP